jgi:hypothetical protein
MPFLSKAQTVQSEVKMDTVTATAGGDNIEAFLNFGFGATNLKVGQTTQNEDVTMSGGGGVSVGMNMCHTISPSLEAILTGAYQNSTLSKKLENAEGSFSRLYLLATLKYRIPVSASGTIKIGGGLGYYLPGSLDLDFSKVSSGGHNVFEYNTALGFHLTCDYEIFVSPMFSWGFGMKYYNVSYNLASATSNGLSVSINSIPQSIRNDVEKLDGTGVDLSAFVSFYL